MAINGHAIECRINTEDPEHGFRPCSGKIDRYIPPGGPGVRVDSALYTGYTIPPYYDSLIGKLVVWGRDRQEAISRMQRSSGVWLRCSPPYLSSGIRNAFFRRVKSIQILSSVFYRIVKTVCVCVGTIFAIINVQICQISVVLPKTTMSEQETLSIVNGPVCHVSVGSVEMEQMKLPVKSIHVWAQSGLPMMVRSLSHTIEIRGSWYERWFAVSWKCWAKKPVHYYWRWGKRQNRSSDNGL